MSRALLDSDGNVVLDADGNVVLVDEPGALSMSDGTATPRRLMTVVRPLRLMTVTQPYRLQKVTP